MTEITRATIILGDIELDCYQMPDGHYRFSVNKFCKACKIYHKRVPDILEKKDVKALLGKVLKEPESII